jgi:uncharacterized OsmC-like protein
MTGPSASPPPSVRTYAVRAGTTRTFGRVLASAREHHLVVDGPVQNGCPGEEITPAELFLGGVAACGAELIQVIAREESTPLAAVDVAITGTVDRGKQPRADVTVFTTVHVDIVLTGADDARAAALVEGFRRR